jgi:hypothetical protein
MTACGKNPTLLTQKMLNEAGTCFVIKGEYTADGAILQLADQQELSFENGKIDNAILVGNHSFLKVKSNNPVFGKNVQIKGVWDVDEVHDGWFEYEEGRGFIANQLIKNMLAFSNDATFCHLYFEEDRTYYFELPYHGNASLGDEFSYHINDDGKKKRHYREVYNDEYSFLRIFTIPSNTTLTIDNTLQMLPTNMGAYFVFWEYGKENVTIEGSGIIAGENKDHLYTTPYAGKSYYGEWGFLFRCFKCKKFVFRDITLQDSFGDCIGFSGSTYPNEHGLRCADGLLVENVKIIGARRNGISLSARNVIIRNCHFEDCGIEKVKGTSPRCAIDFESSSVKRYPENGNENVLMENCTFKNNSRDVSTHRNNRKDYGRIATTIKNCIFTDKVKLGNSYWMRFENCYFSFLYNKDDIRSVLLNSHFMEFVNCEFGQWDAKIPKTKTKSNNSFINCKFNK